MVEVAVEVGQVERVPSLGREKSLGRIRGPALAESGDIKE